MRFLLHFGEMVGFGEALDEFFGFGASESEKGDGVNPVFEGNGVVDFVFLDETADLVHLFFRSGFDRGTHLYKFLWLRH